MARKGAGMGRGRARRRLLGAGFGVAALVAAAGCSGGPFGGDASASLSPGGGSSGPIAPPPGSEALASFYQQQLSWEDCDTAKCAWLKVPLDYAKPDGDTLKLRLLKVPARGASRGALFVNPGGPGGSATDYAAMANFAVSNRARQAYDVVGLDPRGVGKSNPIVCIDDEKMDEMMGADPTPDDAAERAAVEKIAKDFGAACQAKYPKLLGHVSTIDAAKDMDIARGALGQQKMTYLGKSYGTYLGSIYAGLFPQQVGRLVLDGAMAPDLTDKELSLGQAKGFETATRAYVKTCISGGNCPLGGDVDQGMKNLKEMLTQLDAQPLPVKGDPRVTKLTEGWGSLGVAQTLYTEKNWPILTNALRAAKAGDGTELFTIAASYVDRKDGTYNGNIMQVISAVNCLDHPVEKLTDAQREADLAEFSKEAPTWGPFMSGSSYTCLNWPVPPNGKPAKVAAEGADPILVVGTTRDPATPYEWAERLARQLKQGRLLTYDGDGHTAYMRANRCVNDTVDDYLVDGKVPDGDTKC